MASGTAAAKESPNLSASFPFHLSWDRSSPPHGFRSASSWEASPRRIDRSSPCSPGTRGAGEPRRPSKRCGFECVSKSRGSPSTSITPPTARVGSAWMSSTRGGASIPRGSTNAGHGPWERSRRPSRLRRKPWQRSSTAASSTSTGSRRCRGWGIDSHWKARGAGAAGPTTWCASSCPTGSGPGAGSTRRTAGSGSSAIGALSTRTSIRGRSGLSRPYRTSARSAARSTRFARGKSKGGRSDGCRRLEFSSWNRIPASASPSFDGRNRRQLLGASGNLFASHASTSSGWNPNGPGLPL
jgi:hypothetical protein